MDALITHDMYELTTAVTNVIWAVVIVVLIVFLNKASEKRESLKKALWVSVLLLLLLVNVLAFFVHGMEFSIKTDHTIWAVMNFMLGLMIALMMSAAIHDYFDKVVMLRFLPFLLVTALVFFSITQIYRDTFLIFVAYQSIFTLLIFAMYIHLALKKFSGANLVSLGVFFLILASAAQAIGRYELDMIIPLNQDGIFHVFAIPGTIFMILGVVANIESSQ